MHAEECNVTMDNNLLYTGNMPDPMFENEVLNGLNGSPLQPVSSSVLSIFANEIDQAGDKALALNNFPNFEVYMNGIEQYLCTFSCYPIQNDATFSNTILPFMQVSLANSTEDPNKMDFNNAASIQLYLGQMSDNLKDLLDQTYGFCTAESGLAIKHLGKKVYEMSNHLGNVLAVITDKKVAVADVSGTLIKHFEAEIVSISDYYPFGMNIQNRSYTAPNKDYRYGFNGFEKDDEVKGSGNHLSYGDNGYDPRLGSRWNIDPFANKFPFQSPYTHAKNSPIAGADVNGDSTVVVIHGQGRAVKSDANGRTNIMYDVEVYQNMTVAQYEVHKTNGTLPDPSYRTELARDAHDLTSKGKTVVHSNQRYGTNNETPPGTYYLFKKGTNGDYNSGAYQLYLGDNNGSRVINGPDGVRAGVAIHQYDPNDSQGCLTTCSGRNTQPVTSFMNAIPDLNDDTQPVQLILQEREVTQTQYSNTANGSVKYKGVKHTYIGDTLPEVTITPKK